MTAPDNTDVSNAAAVARDLAADLAAAQQSPHEIFGADGTAALLYILPSAAGGMIPSVVEVEKYGSRPMQKAGHAAHYTGESLAAYVNAHRLAGQTALYADVRARTIYAVLDGHGQHITAEASTPDLVAAEIVDDRAGWGRHTAALAVRRTPEWEHWLRLDGKLVGQETLAEHLLDGAGEITRPPAADMLELAESFQATSKVDFESASRLDSGQRRLTYSETVAAKAGRKGQLDIPTEFTLGVAPFEGSPAYAVTALFRYRINGGNLQVGYKLVRPNDVELHAFTDIVAVVETATGLVAYRAARPG